MYAKVIVGVVGFDQVKPNTRDLEQHGSTTVSPLTSGPTTTTTTTSYFCLFVQLKEKQTNKQINNK